MSLPTDEKPLPYVSDFEKHGEAKHGLPLWHSYQHVNAKLWVSSDERLKAEMEPCVPATSLGLLNRAPATLTFNQPIPLALNPMGPRELPCMKAAPTDCRKTRWLARRSKSRWQFSRALSSRFFFPETPKPLN